MVIAKALCMTCTVFCYRRRVEFGMLNDPSVVISDEDLEQVIEELRTSMPNVGESMVSGALRSRGYKVTRERVRGTLRRSDPLSAVLRWPGTLTRRHPYSVAGPNSLWHIGTYIQCHACTIMHVSLSLICVWMYANGPLL